MGINGGIKKGIKKGADSIGFITGEHGEI